MMLLGDDGTLDTVIVCSECGEEFRFSFDGGDDDSLPEHAYGEFVKWAKSDATDQHECEGKATP